jgi:hypothetical protein
MTELDLSGGIPQLFNRLGTNCLIGLLESATGTTTHLPAYVTVGPDRLDHSVLGLAGTICGPES